MVFAQDEKELVPEPRAPSFAAHAAFKTSWASDRAETLRRPPTDSLHSSETITTLDQNDPDRISIRISRSSGIWNDRRAERHTREDASTSIVHRLEKRSADPRRLVRHVDCGNWTELNAGTREQLFFNP